MAPGMCGNRFRPVNHRSKPIGDCFRTRNPYTTSIGVYVDGEQTPSKPLKLNLTGNDKKYLESFQTLFTGTGKYHDDAGNHITRDDYHKGYGFFVFDLRPDGCDVSEYLGLRQRGNLSLEIVFSQALTEAINLFCIGNSITLSRLTESETSCTTTHHEHFTVKTSHGKRSQKSQ